MTALQLGNMPAFAGTATNGMNVLTWLTGQALMGNAHDSNLSPRQQAKRSVQAALGALEEIADELAMEKVKEELDAEGG